MWITPASVNHSTLGTVTGVTIDTHDMVVSLPTSTSWSTGFVATAVGESDVSLSDTENVDVQVF